MDLTILAIPAFLGLLALEVVVSRRRGRPVHEGTDSAASLAMGVGSLVVGAGWKVVELAVYFALYRHALFDLGHGPWVVVAAVVADDFAYYWFHRLHHEVRLLWASHVPHHSSQRYNLATALRQSWTPMTTLPFYAPLAWLGFNPLLLFTVHGANLLYQFWIHTELLDRLGPLEWVLNTPSHHRVHHGANPRYLDRNYGGIFIVWDRLFGTFEPEAEPVRYGLTKNLASRNPLVIAFHEWWGVLRDALRPAPFGVWWRRLLAPPGWSPDGTSHTARELRALELGALSSGRAGAVG
jgi:sterol desaturase/sphingolipid hydroxylase (fatty acid hydroxylase superfamily)